MNIFESLENLNVSEECFNDIVGIVEEYINELKDDLKLKVGKMRVNNAFNSIKRQLVSAARAKDAYNNGDSDAVADNAANAVYHKLKANDNTFKANRFAYLFGKNAKSPEAKQQLLDHIAKGQAEGQKMQKALSQGMNNFTAHKLGQHQEKLAKLGTEATNNPDNKEAEAKYQKQR